MSTDYDGPWKDALDAYLARCLELLFPRYHAAIDWTRGYEALDTELQQIAPEAEVGRRYVDRLYKVWLKDGSVGWVLVHIEVQVWPEEEFAERMFVYSYRGYDKLRRPVATFVILADDNAAWRPRSFGWSLLGSRHTLRFPSVKLLSFRRREQALLRSTNPFAKFVLAHLKTLETANDPATRHLWKTRLVRALYEQGLSADDVREMFRLIDWLMDLPAVLKRSFWSEVRQIQEEKTMPYISTPEWVMKQELLVKAIRIGLQAKFGPGGLALLPDIENLDELDQYEAVLDAILPANTLDDIRQVIAAQT